MPPVCRCGKATINTDAHCDTCKQKFLEKALEDEKRNTLVLFNSCFRGDE